MKTIKLDPQIKQDVTDHKIRQIYFPKKMTGLGKH